jgi:hypothetical protein
MCIAKPITRTLWSATVSTVCAVSAGAVEPVDEDYVRSLASPGKAVLVMEYRDDEGRVNKRRGFASISGFASLSATDFRIDAGTVIHLYGIEPCEGDLVNDREAFAGSCQAYAREGLDTLLQGAKVIFCRAFVREENAPVQDATCYGYYSYPDFDAVYMFEQQLVSVGAHRIARTPDGTPLRADLEEAEAIGKIGYGMWADPRIGAR